MTISFLDREKLFLFITKYARPFLFGVLLFTEGLVAYNGYNGFVFTILPLLLLAVENAVKMWGLKIFKRKIVCYVFDSVLLLYLTILSRSNYVFTLYIILLTEFYLSADRFQSALGMGVASIVLYCVAYGMSENYLHQVSVDVVTVVTECFNNIVVFVIHFLVVNFALMIYRQTLIVQKMNKELDESNQKLSKAYDELKTVGVLEERQRIAKDIHDTAGHSVTVVIMQTEAAKLIIDEDPAEAKRKIVAANLQAKHALDELRESVHLLSGEKRHQTLKEELLFVIHETCDGTDIKIKSDVADVILSDTKRRLIVNSLKEGLSNGLRHGHATAFYFELAEDEEKIKFLLSDNGCGADTETLTKGMGLNGMKERVERYGGTLALHSEPEEGFEIQIELPIDKIKNEGGKE